MNLSELAVAQLVSVFETHGGVVPGFEFEAEGFNPPQLMAAGYILKTQFMRPGYSPGPLLQVAMRNQT